MGGFYGSFHFRNTDRENLLTHLRSLARKTNQRFLVSPEHDGWTSVYPSEHGQDPTVAEDINAKIPGDVLAVLSHDEDIMCYWLWRDGVLLDRFSSKRTTPGENPLGEQFSDSGNAKAFKDALTPAQLRGLKKFLRWRFFWCLIPISSIHLYHLGAALNIPHMCESYEYLLEDDTDVNVSTFEHITNRSPQS